MKSATSAMLCGSKSVAALVVGALFGVSARSLQNGIAPRASCMGLTGLTLPDAQILERHAKRRVIAT